MPNLVRYGKRPSFPHRTRQQLSRRSIEQREKTTAAHIVAKTTLFQVERGDQQISFFRQSDAFPHLPGRIPLLDRFHQLRASNRQLIDELRQSRSLLSTMSRESKDTKSSDLNLAGLSDNRIAAAEMIASLDDAVESELVFRILGSDGQSLSDLTQNTDVLKVIHVTSMLANCRAALVHKNSILPTEFGHALFNWITTSVR